MFNHRVISVMLLVLSLAFVACEKDEEKDSSSSQEPVCLDQCAGEEVEAGAQAGEEVEAGAQAGEEVEAGAQAGQSAGEESQGAS